MNVLSIIYRVCSKIHLYFQSAYVVSRLKIKAKSAPRILGKIHFNAKNVIVGSNVTIYPEVYFWGDNIQIGDNVDIGIGTIIYSRNGVKIGSNTSIAGQCYIIDSNHGTKAGELIRNQPMETAREGIIIGDDVWIAAQCSILKGARINDHAVIGAQSLVNSEIPENAIAVGTPARVKSFRK